MEAGLLQGGRASQREAGPLNREAKPCTGRLGLSQGGWASPREAGPLAGRPGLSHRDQAFHREAKLYTFW